MRLEFPVKKIHAISEATMADMLPIGTEQVHVMKISILYILEGRGNTTGVGSNMRRYLQ